MFADDTSLYSAVADENKTAEDPNRDLESVRLWAWQWKMHFNSEKTEEVIFSTKRVKPWHPPLILGNDLVTRKSEHKHLGMILDTKLNFQSHVREAICKARRGIGIIRYLSKYVSRDVLDQPYKLYVRPHLDYGDIIYHKYDPDLRLDLTKRLEQTQYSAALAVTGAWRGTSRQRLFNELGWENLYNRRWCRRLCHFFTLKTTQHPEYLFSHIPPKRKITYNLRNPSAYPEKGSRTARFSSTYFQNVTAEWNLLNSDLRNSESLAAFKRKLISTVRPLKNSIYGVYDIIGIRRLTKLRIEFSPLNGHRFRHNFDCLSPTCAYGCAIEDNQHFLLHCHLFSPIRIDLLGQLTDIPGLDIMNFDSNALCNLLLFGSSQLNIVANRIILEATIAFIEKANRFD